MFDTLSAEIQRWNIICACSLCAVWLAGFLTVYSATAFVILWSGVNYYLHRREENLRHRLSILGLIKHDKRERRRRSEISQRAVCANSATPSRFGSVSFDYSRVTPGNKFDTPSRRSGELNCGAYGLSSSPVLMSKTNILNRSCQSTSTPAHGRRSHLDWLPVTTRRHPIQQEKYSVGSYPVVCLNKSPLPLAKPFSSPELIPAVKVKILPLTTSHVQNQTFGHPAASAEADKQDPCSTESVIQALKERRKRAYQDGLDSTGLSPSQVQSSKRSRRESLCLPQMPPFTPVVTSVGGFGPPYLGSPSKNAVVRGPVPSSLVPTPEATFKRGRLCSTSSPPGSAKRHRNNAIAISYCSSKGILQQARNSQSQKRKAVPSDSTPLSKQTRKEYRGSQSDEEESTEKIEDSSKENDLPSEGEVSKESSEGESVDSSKLRSRVKPLDWSTIEKKKLVYPEHIATLKEHENDQARDKQRLNRLLGGLQDVSDQTNEKTPVTTQADAAKPSTLEKTAGLPTFGIPAAATSSATLVQGLTTNTVSVISSPVMSASSTVASPPQPAEEKNPPALISTPATTTDTSVASAVPTASTAIVAPKPQFGAGFFSSSSTTTASTTASEAVTQVAPASLPATAASAAANPLLAALAKFTSPKATEATTAASPAVSQSLPTPTISAASLPSPQTSALSLPIPSASAAVTVPAPDAVKPAAGGFVFSGPSLGGNKPISSTPSIAPAQPCFGTAVGTTAVLPSMPMFKANNTNTTVASATSPTPAPFQFGSNTQVAKPTTSQGFLVTASSSPEPFKFGSSGGLAASATTTNTTQAASPSLGGFKFGTVTPVGPQVSASLLQTSTSSLSGSGTSMFNFGAGAAPKSTATLSAPLFGSVAAQAPATATTGIGTQPASSGFTFGAGASAASSTTATTQAGFSFGASSAAAASSGSGPVFKFGTQGQQPQQATASAPLSTATTAASLFSGAPFKFGTPVPKQDAAPAVPQSFSFGAASTTPAAPANSTPFAFGASSSGPAAASTFAFGAPATTTAPSAAPFSFGAGTTSTPAFPQSSATSPLFPSAASVGQPSVAVAQPGGFQFGASQVQNAFGAATNGLSNGISSGAAQPSVAAPGLFKFGAANNSSVPAFNFGASQCGTNATPKPAFNFGAPAATSNLFSIGTTSSHSERPLARPRSKRITKK
ncbi:ice-structuring glycoprotein isoform X2 [Rhipicephalus sanguineus]|uniref:ice-structuring glycoprotein isoform X2 n=1 Tax=Rhipicephalus sanguineus TaxID=34632 RepID=UPI001893B200|nr:ice-structuring glycoprotein isoform X2 [Rhipicephalus sanguineus]